jgi:phosphoacetylglucosamine mutase
VNPETDRLKKFASVDGDADRLIYYYLDSNGTFRMLDGDKIATLYALYIREELQTVGSLQLRMGVVQTAYANGASTKYLEKTMQIEVACTPTGVKHLHHRATEFDIGIYFEANGHGTVVFKEEAVHKMQELQAKWEHDSSVASEKKAALDRLINLPDLINQAVGDALSDLLFVEAILRHKNWSLQDWDKIYQDMPNRLKAQSVSDRKIFVTTDAERRLVQPAGLQDKIDALVRKYEDGRSFVRPSGTEDVVRVYAEAKTQQQADALADEVSKLLV